MLFVPSIFNILFLLLLHVAQRKSFGLFSILRHYPQHKYDGFALFHSMETSKSEEEVLFGVSYVHIRMYNSLLFECVNSGNTQEANEIYTQMVLSDTQPNLQSYEYLIQIWLNSNETSSIYEAELAFNQLLKAGFMPSKSLITKLMKAFGDIQVPEKVEQIFDRVSLYEIYCDVDIYNTVMEAWGYSNRTNSFNMVEEIYERMSYADVAPNSKTYDILIKSCSKMHERVDCAEKSYSILKTMLSEGFQPSIESYEAVSNACVENGIRNVVVDIAFEIIKIMETNNLQPTLICYENYIKLLIKSNICNEMNDEIISKVLDTYKLMKIHNNERTDKMLITIINTLIRQKSQKYIKIAEDYLSLAETTNIVVPYETYVNLINAYGILNRAKSAESSLNRLIMNHNDIYPKTAFPWNCVISAYGKSCLSGSNNGFSSPISVASLNYPGNDRLLAASNAERVFKNMIDSGVEPDQWTYSSLINIWTECDELAKAEEVLKIMLSKDMTIPAISIKSQIYGWLRQNKNYTINDDQKLKINSKVILLYDQMCLSYIRKYTNSSLYNIAEVYEDISSIELIFNEIIQSNIDVNISFFNIILRVISIITPAILRPTFNDFSYNDNKVILPSLNSSISDVAERAIKIFGQMLSVNIIPNAESYELLIKTFEMYSYSGYSKIYISDKVIEVINHMLQLGLRPSCNMYESIIKIWANSKRPDAPRVTENIFKSMIEINGLKEPPSIEIFNLLMKVWATSMLPNAVKKVQEVYQTIVDANIKPTITTFSLMLRALANQKKMKYSDALVVDDVEEAEKIFNLCHMNGLSPNESMYRSLILILSRNNTIENMNKLESIIMHLSEVMNNSCNTALPTLHISSYGVIVSAWKLHAIENIESLLLKLSKLYLTKYNKGFYIVYNLYFAACTKLAPETYFSKVYENIYNSYVLKMENLSIEEETLSLNLVLECLLRSGRKDGVELCEKLIYNEQKRIHPNEYTLTLAMKLWSKYNVKNIPMKAQSLFDQIISTNNNLNNNNHVVNSAAFTLLADAWCNDDPLHSTNILYTMISSAMTPPASLYSNIMSSWAKQGRADMCENIFNQILATGQKPDPLSCRILLSTLSSLDKSDSAERTVDALDHILRSGIKLDGYMVASVLSAWSKSSSPLAASKAEDCLLKAISAGAKMTVALVNILLDIYGKSKNHNAPEIAENWINKMIEYKISPTIDSYNSVIYAWGQSSRLDAEKRCSKLLHKALDTGVKPDVVTYSSILSAVSKAKDNDAPNRANKIFETMLEKGIIPDTMAWTILITIWSKSNVEGKEEKVQKIYDDMIRSGCIPNTVTFTALLTMWSTSKIPSASQKIIDIFKKMRQSDGKGILDIVGYSSLLSALSKSNDINAPIKASAIFEQLLQSRLTPDIQSWTILIAIWSKSNLEDKVEKVQEIYNRMIKSGYAPNAVTYSTMLKMWTSILEKNNTYNPNSIEYAKQNILNIYDSIRDENVRLDGIGFRLLHNALQKVVTPTECLNKIECIFMCMLDFGMAPDVAAWENLVYNYNLNKDYDKSIKLYQLMIESSGVLPSRSIYINCLSAMVKSKSTDGVLLSENIISSMIKNNFYPSYKEYNSYFLILRRSNLIKNDKFGKLKENYYKMKQIKLKPDIMTLNIALDIINFESISDSYDITEEKCHFALELFDEVTNSNLSLLYASKDRNINTIKVNTLDVVSIETIDSLFACFLRVKRPSITAVAQELINYVEINNLGYTYNTYSRYIKLFSLQHITQGEFLYSINFIDKKILPFYSPNNTDCRIKNAKDPLLFSILILLSKKLKITSDIQHNKMKIVVTLLRYKKNYGILKDYLPKLNEVLSASKTDKNVFLATELCKKCDVNIV